MRKVNVALLGHRFMGRAHSNAWHKANQFFELELEPVRKLVVGRDEEATQEFADRWGWEETGADWREAVERDDIDIVDISLPTHLHHEAALAAAKAGKHIFCEKPFSLTGAEARAMLEAANEAGVVHYLNHNYRRCPAVALAKRFIEEGRLGRLFHWRGAYQQSWLIDPREPMRWQLREATARGGPLWDLHSHTVDLAHYLVGDIATVQCLTSQFVAERPAAPDSEVMEKVGVDDAALLMVEFRNGAMGSFEATRYATGRRNRHTFELYGSEGALAWDLEDMNRLHFFDTKNDREAQGWSNILATEPCHPYAMWWPPGHIIGYEHAFVHAVADFLEAIAEGRSIEPNFSDGVRIIEVLETAKRAAQSGRRETVAA